MKIIYLISLFTVALLFSCNETANQKVSCSKYKIGNFLYKVRAKENPSAVFINRNDSIQTEIIKNTGDTGTLKIIWIDDCTYELRYLKIISKEPDSLTFFKKAMKIKTKIIGGTDIYYLFESTNDKNTFVLRDTIWITK